MPRGLAFFFPTQSTASGADMADEELVKLIQLVEGLQDHLRKLRGEVGQLTHRGRGDILYIVKFASGIVRHCDHEATASLDGSSKLGWQCVRQELAILKDGHERRSFKINGRCTYFYIHTQEIPDVFGRRQERFVGTCRLQSSGTPSNYPDFETDQPPLFANGTSLVIRFSEIQTKLRAAVDSANLRSKFYPSEAAAFCQYALPPGKAQSQTAGEAPCVS